AKRSLSNRCGSACCQTKVYCHCCGKSIRATPTCCRPFLMMVVACKTAGCVNHCYRGKEQILNCLLLRAKRLSKMVTTTTAAISPNSWHVGQNLAIATP